MKKCKNIFLCLITILMIISMFPVSVYANTDCINDAKNYYQAYGFDLDIKACENKYTSGPNTTYKYSVTYVTTGGEVVNLYLDEIPKNFNLWNTDIVVTDGRVVVAGVNGDTEDTWNLIFSKYKGFIVGVSGLGALSCVLAFVMAFIKMGAISGNPGERSKFMATLLFTGFGALGLGSVVIIFGFFWNVL